jgi:hypothetical protein
MLLKKEKRIGYSLASRSSGTQLRTVSKKKEKHPLVLMELLSLSKHLELEVMEVGLLKRI